MNIIDQIRADIANPKCFGFVFDSDGNSIRVKKVGSKLYATYESWAGKQIVVENESLNHIEIHINDLLIMDDNCFYMPNFKPAKWSKRQINEFMDDIQSHLCNPCFNGFKLEADGVGSFIVRKNRWGFSPWIIDDNVGDLVDVMTKTRAKLNENVYWEYVSL